MNALPAAAIVLAGGRSSRFGADKLATDLGGRPLLHHAIGAVAGVVREIVVVLAADGLEPPLPAEMAVPVRFARDAGDGHGPVAGVAAGLAMTTQPLAIIVGGDQPALVPGLLHEMLRLVAPGGGRRLEAVALEEDGRIRPLPCAVRVAAVRPAAALAVAAGGGSLVGLLGRLRLGVLPPDRWQLLDPVGASLCDVDRSSDLAKAARQSIGPPVEP